MTGWRASTWGDEVSLEYGKSLRDYAEGKGPFRVFGSNGPVGWTDEPLAPGPGVILGRKGAYRGVRFSAEPFYVIDTAYYVVPKTELDMRWLYYAIIHHKLGEIDDGSPIPSTTRSAVYVRDIDVPELPEQQAIAAVLSALDEKIELNRQMNETLEASARALFRDWFVNFGPTRAKMVGAAPYLAPDIWSLFPDSLDGEGNPVGWTISEIYQIAEVIYGAAFASDRFNSERVGRPLVRIRDLSNHEGGFFTDETHKKEYLIQPGSIVVGMDGEFRAYVWQGEPSLMNQRVCCFSPKSAGDRAFLWFAIQPHLDSCEKSAIGTTVIHLGKKDIDRFNFIDPGLKLLQAFSRIAEPLVDQIVRNGQESRTLAEARDVLLPKLMSGQIRVSQAEKLAGDQL